MSQRFKVGERVRFLHEKQEGIVQRVISPSKLEVLVDDFFELEVHPSDIVPIHASEDVLAREAEVDALPDSTAQMAVEIDRAASLVVVQTPERNYEFRIQNPGRRELLFAAYQKHKGKYTPLNSALIAPGSDFLIAKMTTEEVHKVQTLHLQVLEFFTGDHAKPVPPLELELPVRMTIMEQKAEEIREFGRPGWEFVLEPPKKVKQLQSEMTPAVAAESTETPAQPPRIVDLHVQYVVDNPVGLDANTVLRLQLEHFEQQISKAHGGNVKEMVFIHGIGTGRLKREIHDRLRAYPFVARFKLADPMKYGNGATIVYLM